MKKILVLLSALAFSCISVAQPVSKNQQLMDACHEGDYTLMTELINQGADIFSNQNTDSLPFIFYYLYFIDKYDITRYQMDLNIPVFMACIQQGLDVFAPIKAENCPAAVNIAGSSHIELIPADLIIRLFSFDIFENDIVQSIKMGRFKNTPDKKGNTALHYAALGNASIEIFQALVSAGCDVNAKNLQGNTPLHVCAESLDNDTIATFLVQHEADVNATNLRGYTPLALAYNNIPVARLLITNGAELNKPVNDSVSGPMFFYCYNIAFPDDHLFRIFRNAAIVDETTEDINNALDDNLDVLKLAIEHGFDVFKEIHGTVLNPQTMIVFDEISWDEYLIDTMIVEQYSFYPYYLLSRNQKIEENEANIIKNINSGLYKGQDIAGNTALHYVAVVGNSLPIVNALINNKFEINARNKQGMTPLLYFACPDSLGDYTLEVKAKDLSIANTLIRAGADFEYTPSSSLGSFAFYIFDAIDHTEKFYNRFSEYPKDELFSIIKLMISDGLHVFQPLSYHSTYLDYVVMYGEYDDVVESALTINIDITIYPYWTIVKHNKCLEFENEIITKLDAAMCMTPDEFGNTALHIAAAVGNSIPIIKAILDLGADVNARNMEGVDVLHAYTFPSIIIWDEAINHIHDFSIAKMLIEAGAEVNVSDRPVYFPLMACVLGALSEQADNGFTDFYKYEADSLLNILLLAVNNGFNVFDPIILKFDKVEQYTSTDMYGEMVVYDSVVEIEKTYIPYEIITHFDVFSDFEKAILKQLKSTHPCDSFTSDQLTPLHIASGYGCSTKIVNLLIKKSCDVNSNDIDGNTPLHAAAMNPLGLPIVKMLISAKTDAGVIDKNGHNPEQVARMAKNLESADFLKAQLDKK